MTYKTAWDVGGSLEKYLSAEMAAWAMAFGLGKVVKSGTLPNFIYTCTPLFPANGDATELPYFSFVEQIRPGAGVVLDRQAVGCAVESWQIAIGSGPGRANSKITVEFAGSGKVIDSATGIVMPTATVEKLLPSASLTLSINGVDYVTSKNIVSLETGWKNNLRMDAGFFPGSGFQTAGDGSSGAIRGRLEFGNRAGNLKFVARYDSTSTGVRQAQSANDRHRRHQPLIRRQQLARDHLAEDGVLRGRDRRDGPDPYRVRRVQPSLRFHQRHRFCGCQVQRGRYLPVEKGNHHWIPPFLTRAGRSR